MANNNPTGKTYVGSEELYADVQRCMKLVAEMNTCYHTEAEVRERKQSDKSLKTQYHNEKVSIIRIRGHHRAGGLQEYRQQ